MALVSEPSIQNGLEIALKTLKMVPSHASREILMILGSLTTCDPGDINETIEVCIFNIHLKLNILYLFFYVRI